MCRRRGAGSGCAGQSGEVTSRVSTVWVKDLDVEAFERLDLLLDALNGRHD
jgi:hypothetical protein